jgi:hypothetical protein
MNMAFDHERHSKGPCSIMRSKLILAAALLLTLPLHAQKQSQAGSGYDLANRATLLHTANVYVTPDTSTPPITTISPGHEVVISSRNGQWINIFIATEPSRDVDPDSKPIFDEPDPHPGISTGWIHDQGVVTARTPNGAAIIFGTAAEYEDKASSPHSPTGAAAAAPRLYDRVVDYFPESPLGPEAFFRAADIRWQLERADIATLPSAKEQDAYLRPQLYEGELRDVMKSFPNSDYAARAAFDLLDNKVCGDWQGLPRCPEIETRLYLQYADQYRGGPKSAEALYDAAYRQGVLVTMYKVDDNPKLSTIAAHTCQSIADRLQHDYPKSDYAARAASIAFRVAQGLPIYGTDRS